MATVASNPQTTTRPNPSPAPSSSSLASDHDKLSSPPSGNGSAVDVKDVKDLKSAQPPNGDSITVAQPKKPTLSRLTRMFSSKNTSAESNPSSRDQSQVASPELTGMVPPNTTLKPADAERRPTAGNRSRSSSNALKQQPNGSSENKATPSPVAEKKDGLALQSRRFVIREDGTHEHNLKPDRRQEKLSDMFKSWLGGRKKDDSGHELSLVSSWVDQVKNEKVANDKQGGPNYAHTLVEKYGKCHEVVGRGAFGIVRISHKTDSKDPRKEQLYAVKEFRRRPQESPKKYNKRLTSEFCISSALRHPNVIHTLDLMKDAKGDFCEVMEYCAGGDLYTLVLAAGKLEVVEADCYFKQLMRGVEYIHEMGVSHRDLKPENLLLTTHGSLKITDFGNGECFRMAWEQEPHMVAGLCGSAPYISPEEYIDNEFDPRAVDVWACGVIYMAMRTGRHLWRVAQKEEDEFYRKYLEGRRDEDGYGPIETLHRARCRNVIYSILDPNPSRRITASQVLKSEWGREIKLCKAGEEGF